MDDGLDPIMAGWGVFGESLLFSSLLHLEDDFSVSKELATDYTISDDGLRK